MSPRQAEAAGTLVIRTGNETCALGGSTGVAGVRLRTPARGPRDRGPKTDPRHPDDHDGTQASLLIRMRRPFSVALLGALVPALAGCRDPEDGRPRGGGNGGDGG